MVLVFRFVCWLTRRPEGPLAGPEAYGDCSFRAFTSLLVEDSVVHFELSFRGGKRYELGSIEQVSQ